MWVSVVKILTSYHRYVPHVVYLTENIHSLGDKFVLATFSLAAIGRGTLFDLFMRQRACLWDILELHEPIGLSHKTRSKIQKFCRLLNEELAQLRTIRFYFEKYVKWEFTSVCWCEKSSIVKNYLSPLSPVSREILKTNRITTTTRSWSDRKRWHAQLQLDSHIAVDNYKSAGQAICKKCQEKVEKKTGVNVKSDKTREKVEKLAKQWHAIKPLTAIQAFKLRHIIKGRFVCLTMVCIDRPVNGVSQGGKLAD